MDIILVIKYLALLAFSLVLGALSAIPVGAVQLDVAKKAINGHLKQAVAVALGSTTSDLLYGVVTLFGLGAFLLDRKAQIFIYSIGIVVLSFLVYRSFKERHGVHRDAYPLVYTKRISFLTGFTIAVSNPGIIAWWIIGLKVLQDLSLFAEIDVSVKLVFILGGCAGLGGYLIFIANVLHRMKMNFSDAFIRRMTGTVLVLLIVVLAYFIYKVAELIIAS